MTGMSKWAVINGIWAAGRHKGYFADKVYLLNKVGNKTEEDQLVKSIKEYYKSHGKDTVVMIETVDEKEFVATGKKITKIIETEKAQGNEVALETTPGRKAVVSSALVAAREKKVDHIFYLYIEDVYMADKPYPMIPFQIQRAVDLEKEVWM